MLTLMLSVSIPAIAVQQPYVLRSVWGLTLTCVQPKAWPISVMTCRKPWGFNGLPFHVVKRAGHSFLADTLSRSVTYLRMALATFGDSLT